MPSAGGGDTDDGAPMGRQTSAEVKIGQLGEMGFARRDSERALNSTFGRLDLAIDDLLLKVETLEAEAQQASAHSLVATRSARASQQAEDRAAQSILPPYWTPIGPRWDRSRVQKIKLSPQANAREYERVAKRFHASCKPANHSIEEIWRIQNFEEWHLFHAMGRRMEERKDGTGANLQYLFHGTTPDAATKICKYNFNRIYTNSNSGRSVFGKGVYFAREARYSASTTYARPAPGGEQYMILARVLVGHSAPGHQDLLEPPERQLPNGESKRYDSLSGDQGKYNIVVSCHRDGQAYAEYVIVFKARTGHQPGPMPPFGLAVGLPWAGTGLARAPIPAAQPVPVVQHVQWPLGPVQAQLASAVASAHAGPGWQGTFVPRSLPTRPPPIQFPGIRPPAPFPQPSPPAPATAPPTLPPVPAPPQQMPVVLAQVPAAAGDKPAHAAPVTALLRHDVATAAAAAVVPAAAYFSGAEDGSLICWDLATKTGTQVAQPTVASPAVRSLAFEAQAGWLLVGTELGDLVAYSQDGSTGADGLILNRHSGTAALTAILASVPLEASVPSGMTIVVTGYDDGLVKMLQIDQASKATIEHTVIATSDADPQSPLPALSSVLYLTLDPSAKLGGSTPVRLFVACMDTSRAAQQLLRFDGILVFDLNQPGMPYVGSLLHSASTAPYWKGSLHHEIFGLAWKNGSLLSVVDAYPGPAQCAVPSQAQSGKWAGECGEVVVWGSPERVCGGGCVSPLCRLGLGLSLNSQPETVWHEGRARFGGWAQGAAGEYLSLVYESKALSHGAPIPHHLIRLALYTSPLLTPTAISGEWTLRERTLRPPPASADAFQAVVRLTVDEAGTLEGSCEIPSVLKAISHGRIVGPCGGHLYRSFAGVRAPPKDGLMVLTWTTFSKGQLPCHAEATLIDESHIRGQWWSEPMHNVMPQTLLDFLKVHNVDAAVTIDSKSSRQHLCKLVTIDQLKDYPGAAQCDLCPTSIQPGSSEYFFHAEVANAGPTSGGFDACLRCARPALLDKALRYVAPDALPHGRVGTFSLRRGDGQAQPSSGGGGGGVGGGSHVVASQHRVNTCTRAVDVADCSPGNLSVLPAALVGGPAVADTAVMAGSGLLPSDCFAASVCVAPRRTAADHSIQQVAL